MSNKSRLLEKSAKVGERPAEKKEALSPSMTVPGKMLLFQDQMSQMEGARRKLEEEKQALLQKIEEMSKSTFEVDIKDLVEVTGRRRFLSEEQFAELVENLRTNDLVHPIVVRDLPGGKFEIIAGHNRTEAYRKLGRTRILAIRKDYDESRAVKSALYSNLLSPSLLDFEKFKGLKQVRDLDGLTNTELASESGISKSLISYLFSFEKLSDAALIAVESEPSLFKARAVYDILNKAEKESVEKDVLDEAFRKLARQEVTPDQVLGSFEKKPVKPSVQKQTLDVKVGRSKICTIMRTGASVRLVFKNESDIPEDVLQKIGELIEQSLA